MKITVYCPMCIGDRVMPDPQCNICDAIGYFPLEQGGDGGRCVCVHPCDLCGGHGELDIFVPEHMIEDGSYLNLQYIGVE